MVHLPNLLVKPMGYYLTDKAEIDVKDAGSTHLLMLDSTIIDEVKDQVNGRKETLREYFE